MIWGDQWLCPCGTNNLFIRMKCRECSEPKLPDEKHEHPFVTLQKLTKPQDPFPGGRP